MTQYFNLVLFLKVNNNLHTLLNKTKIANYMTTYDNCKKL